MADEKNKIAEEDQAEIRTARLKVASNDPDKYSQLVNEDLNKINNAFDHIGARGRIAGTDEEAYSKIMSTPDGEKVENLVCTTGHQAEANLINKTRSGEAAVTDSINIGKHSYLVYTPKVGSNDYFGSSWGQLNSRFEADNMLTAVQLSNVYTPGQLNKGFDIFYSKDGNHFTLNRFALGELIPMKSNFDNNSQAVLRAPFEQVSNNKTGLKISVGATTGKHPLFGNFWSQTAHADLNKNWNLGENLNLKLNAQGTISNIDAYQTKLAADGSKKYANYNVAGAHAGLMLSTVPLKLDEKAKVSVTPFVYGDINTEGVLKAKAYTETSGDTKTLNRAKVMFTGGNGGMGIYGGINYKAENENLKVDTTAYAGARAVYDRSLYTQKFKLADEEVFGVKTGAEGKWKTGGASFGVSGEASMVNVNANYYDLSNKYVKLGQEISFSGVSCYANEGLSNDKIKFKEYSGVYRKTNPFFTVGCEGDVGKGASLGVNVEKYGSGMSGMAALKVGL